MSRLSPGRFGSTVGLDTGPSLAGVNVPSVPWFPSRGFPRPSRGFPFCTRWRTGPEERYRVVMGMCDMPNPRYDQAKRSVQALGPADQLRLIGELIGRLSGELDRQPRRSLLELQGLGKGVWQAVDVDEYLRRERSSWNG